MKRLVILGSTGNVGTQVLDIVAKYPDRLRVVGLVAYNNIALLKEQIERFVPQYVGVADPAKAAELQKMVDVPVLSGDDAVRDIASLAAEYDVLVNALVSLSGIRVTLNAIALGKDIALANKETLVAAGEIVMQKAREKGVRIMPIDSEHSALFQCLVGENPDTVAQLIITCSGGALRDHTVDQLKNVTVQDALGHKTWSMGHKITIDSATLMNKGFEVIEAMRLYDVPVDQIKVVIHKESIIHSMVEYSDGSIMAQMSCPDMRLPIQYALSYPKRWDLPIKRFDFTTDLTFAEPDLERFPCLGLAFDAARKGGTLPAAMNAANDYMVAQFLDGKCAYLDIPRVIGDVMRSHRIVHHPTLGNIEQAIVDATVHARELSASCKI